MAADERVQFIPLEDVQSSLPTHHEQFRESRHESVEQDKSGAPKNAAASEGNKRIHWKVPSLMASGLIIGIVFALIHHFFYVYWNRKDVRSSSQQQWVVRGGTGFAFAVKTAFALATGIAYVQVLWLRLRSRSSKVGRIDSMFGILGNAWEFHDLTLWLGAPALAIPAIITWSMPLVAIIAPGTITTRPSLSNRTEKDVVPQFNFSDDTKFGNLAPDGGKWKPTNGLYQLTKAVAYGGSLLPATPPALNSSYQLSIFAPYLGCTKADDGVLAAFSNITGNWSMDNEGSLEYLAWVPGPGDFPGSYNISNIDALPVTFTDTSTQDASEIFIFATLGEGNDATANNENVGEGIISSPLNVLMSCKLQNTSYALSFNFTNGIQNLSVQGITPTADTFFNEDDANLPASMPKWSYISLMMSYASVLIGHVATSQSDQSEEINGTTILSTNLGKYLYSEGSSDPSNKTYQELPGIFQAGLEELFFNLTFSMLSNPTYLLSSPTAPQVSVTVSYPTQIYIYHPADLYIAYGISLLCTLLCLALGINAIIENGSTFSNDFSSILRSTRNPELNTIIRPDKFSGSDPLPKYTAKSTIRYHVPEDGIAGFKLVDARLQALDRSGAATPLLHS